MRKELIKSKQTGQLSNQFIIKAWQHAGKKGNEEDCQELVIRLYRYWHRIDPDKNIKAYLNRMLWNIQTDRLKRQSKHEDKPNTIGIYHGEYSDERKQNRLRLQALRSANSGADESARNRDRGKDRTHEQDGSERRAVAADDG